MTEKRIRKAFEHVAPDHLNDVMEQCNAQKQQQKGKILSMTNKTPAPKRSRLPRILAAAAALVLLLTGTAVYGLNTRVCATVALDVNPSIELNVNRRERVVSVSPINNDGKQILGDMDLTGSDLQVAVNALWAPCSARAIFPSFPTPSSSAWTAVIPAKAPLFRKG